MSWAYFLKVLSGLLELFRVLKMVLDDFRELGGFGDFMGELMLFAVGEGDGFLGHGAAEGVVQDGDAREDGFTGEPGAGATEQDIGTL